MQRKHLTKYNISSFMIKILRNALFIFNLFKTIEAKFGKPTLSIV